MEDTNNTWTKPGQNLDITWTKTGQNLDKTVNEEYELNFEVLSSFVHPRGFGQDGFNLVKTTRFCPSGQNLPTLGRRHPFS